MFYWDKVESFSFLFLPELAKDRLLPRVLFEGNLEFMFTIKPRKFGQHGKTYVKLHFRKQNR